MARRSKDQSGFILNSTMTSNRPEDLPYGFSDEMKIDEKIKCKTEGCITILNSRNESDYCHKCQKNRMLNRMFLKKRR